MSLRNIKSKIRAINKTRQVTKAMEAVSAAKMRKAQERAILARPFAVTALSLLERLSKTNDIKESPLMKAGAGRKTLFVVLTSDRGLAGNLNSAVLRAVVGKIKEDNVTPGECGFITLGKKGAEYFRKRGYDVLFTENKQADLKTIEEIHLIREEILKRFPAQFNRVCIAYTNFQSTLSQEPVVRQILPLVPEEVGSIVEGIVPTRGRYADLFTERRISSATSGYEFEPTPEAVLDTVLRSLLSAALYHSFMEAKASEFSARMVAMKNASDKGKERSAELTLSYNKARQAAITKEMLEIIGGMEALV